MATPLDIQISARRVLPDGTGEAPFWLPASTPAVQGGGPVGALKWSNLTAKPALIVDPVAGQGADFDSGYPGTQSGGLVEAIGAVANSTIFATNLNELCVMPGAVVTSIPVDVTAPRLVLRGSGKNASSIKAGFTPSAGQNLMYWPLTPTNKNAIQEGTYIGHLTWDLNNQSFGYGVAPGYPGGYAPDPTSSATLFEHLTTAGTGGVTVGVSFSGIEDTVALHCSFSGAATGLQGSPTGVYGLEWMVYNGSLAIIGGNQAAMNLQGSNPNVTDASWTTITIGNTLTAPCKVKILGRGSNGYPSSTSTTITPLIYVYSTAQVVYLTTTGIDWSLNCSGSSNYATAYSGLIGGPGAGGVYLVDNGSYFNVNSTGQNQPLFGLLSYGGSMASGYASLQSGGILSSIASFLGTGNFINGTLVLEGGTSQYTLMNGVVRPYGLVSAPFGEAVPSWQGSEVSAVGPTVQGGTASPSASQTYRVVGTPILLVCTGGNPSITIQDPNGNVIASGLSSIPAPGVQLYPGYTINFGAFTTTPSTGVYGV